MTCLRRLASSLAIALWAASTWLPGTAAAQEVYTYWSLWQGEEGQWRYAQMGAASIAAVDGSVVGWRFTRSDAPDWPSAPADFDSVCAGVAADAGEVRVAQVVDYGDGADAPQLSRECVVVSAGSSLADVLLAEHAVRAETGFVCAVDALPEAGCAEPVTAGQGQARSAGANGEPEQDSGSSSAVLAAGGGVLAVLAVAALLGAQRRGARR